MDRKKRIEYLAVTSCVLLSGFVIYGLVGSMTPSINDNYILSFLSIGGLGGLGFSAIISGIILAVRFFSQKSLQFKIIAAILWPITCAGVVYVGVLGFLPYQIYNIVKIVKENPRAAQ